MTRASAFVTRSAEEAAALGRWIEAELPKMREWLAGRDEEWISRYAKLREVETYVAGPICHVMWAFTTGDACGPNMMTRNAYALNMGYVMEHAPPKAGARDPRGEHGRRQEGLAPLLRARRAREDGRSPR